MRKKTALSIILVMLLSLLSQYIYFPSSAKVAMASEAGFATLSDVYSEVYVRKGGGLREIQGMKGMPLAQGDSVRTDKKGSAIITFATGSKITLGPGTVITLIKATPTKNSGGKISIKLRAGTLWSKVQSLNNKDDEYEIVTPTSVMRAKGTLFLANVDPSSGETTGAIMEGAIGGQQNTPRDTGQNERLVPMGKSIHIPSNQDQDSSTPPAPTPIDMNDIIENENPSILAQITQDIISRMHELHQQTQSYLSGYENTNNVDYLQAALQLAEINCLLEDLSREYMGAIQGTEQEQQMNEILRENNTSVENLKQQIEQLTNELQEMRDNLLEIAQQAGINSEDTERILQNAPTASATMGATTDHVHRPTPAPPPQPGAIVPTPPNTPTDSPPPTITPTPSPTPTIPPTATPSTPPVSPTPVVSIELTSIGDILGSAKVGEELTAGILVPADATVTYQWMKSDSEQGVYVDIPGATANKYILNEADEGKYIRVKATGYGDYLGTVVSTSTAKVEGIGPIPLNDFKCMYITDTRASFAWTQAIDAIQIALQFSENGETWEECQVDSGMILPTDTSATVSWLQPGKTYHFRLAVLGGSNEGTSNELLLKTNEPLEYGGAYVTNLNGGNGSHGTYIEIPDNFNFIGILGENLLPQVISAARLEFLLWYYDENLQRWYVSLDGNFLLNDLVQGFEVSVEEQEFGNYQWTAVLPEAIRTAINQGPNREYFIELNLINKIEDSNPEAELRKKIITGSFNIDKIPS